MRQVMDIMNEQDPSVAAIQKVYSAHHEHGHYMLSLTFFGESMLVSYPMGCRAAASILHTQCMENLSRLIEQSVEALIYGEELYA